MGASDLTQEKVLAIVPKCGASLSIPCSIFLIYEVWCDHRTRGSTPIQRALVGMSVVDILSSSAWFMSSWAVPQGTWVYAAGNKATCNYQGFLLQLAIGAPLFNASLGLYYALMIRKKWTDKMLCRLEKWVHGVIWTFSIGTSCLLLPLKQYNAIGQVCWIIGSPVDCGDSTHISNPDVPCERGDHAWLYGVFLFYGPLWICVACCIVCMFMVYTEVRKTINRSRRYSFDTRNSRNIGRNEVDAVAIQAILYTLSFIVTWMPSTLWSVAHWFRFAAFWLDFLSAFCEPLQGLWNFLIFIRARTRTKIKILNALSLVFPCLRPNIRDSEISRERSGNGRRTSSDSGHFQTSITSASAAFYRAASVRGMQHNSSMVNNSSERNSSVSFAEDRSNNLAISLTDSPPESPPKATFTIDEEENSSLGPVTEQSIKSVIDVECVKDDDNGSTGQISPSSPLVSGDGEVSGEDFQGGNDKGGNAAVISDAQDEVENLKLHERVQKRLLRCTPPVSANWRTSGAEVNDGDGDGDGEFTRESVDGFTNDIVVIKNDDDGVPSTKSGKEGHAMYFC